MKALPDVAQAASARSGPLTMLVGYVLLGVMPVFVKLAGAAGLSAAETVAGRFAVSFVAVFVVARLRRQVLRTDQPLLLILRGVLGGSAVLLFFIAVQRSGAGMGTLLNYTYPFWANLFALFMGQRTKRAFWPLSLVALIGVYLAVDPAVRGFGAGEIAGLCSAVLAGGVVLCIKQLRETDGELTIVLSFSSLGFLFALPLVIWRWQEDPTFGMAWHAPKAWALLFVIGLCAFVGHLYFTRGYKHTSIELGSMLSFTTPLVAALGGALFLNEALSTRFWLGVFLVGVSSALLGYFERNARGALNQARTSR